MPEVHQFNDHDFQHMIRILAHSDNFSFFTIKAIQSMIEYNYTLVKRTIVLFMAIPFIIFHILYATFTNVIIENLHESDT